ncbi:MAG: hypothetical protein ACRELA_10410 [Candidatus Rokuibacteriota bacterium]
MKAKTRRTPCRLTSLAVACLVIASCGGGNDGGGTTGPSAANVTISDFRVRPLTSVFENRQTQLEITVTASDPDSFVGALAVIKQLGTTEVRRGQTPASPSVIASLAIARGNLIGNRLRLIMTVRLPLGRSTLGFSVASPEVFAQTVQAGKTVRVSQIQSNEIVFVIKAVEVPPDPTPPPAPVIPPAPPVPATVTVAATDAAAFEAGVDPGTFTVTRTGATGAPLTVFFAVSGTATSGLDFVALGTSVTIPAGSSSAAVVVTPIDDFSYESTPETVILTLSADPSYIVGAPSSATVTITSDE